MFRRTAGSKLPYLVLPCFHLSLRMERPVLAIGFQRSARSRHGEPPELLELLELLELPCNSFGSKHLHGFHCPAPTKD
jgi:hypothetical protein